MHQRTDELFYVLEGEVTFEVAGHIQRASAGTFLYIPPDTTHTFATQGTAPARLLITVLSGRFEGYFTELQVHSEGPASWEDINRRFDVHVVGPPLDT